MGLQPWRFCGKRVTSLAAFGSPSASQGGPQLCALHKNRQEWLSRPCYRWRMNRAIDQTRTSLVTRTLWRIETELARVPSLAFLAAEEDVSPFHLTRAFALVTGRPVMAYVRAGACPRLRDD